MNAGDPYTKIYDSARFDPALARPEVFAAYVHMKGAYEGTYPTPAAIPRSADMAIIGELVRSGRVTLTGGGDYFVLPEIGIERTEQAAYHSMGGKARASGPRALDGRYVSVITSSTDSSAGQPESDYQQGSSTELNGSDLNGSDLNGSETAGPTGQLVAVPPIGPPGSRDGSTGRTEPILTHWQKQRASRREASESEW